MVVGAIQGRCEEVSGTICTPASDGWLQRPEGRRAEPIFSLLILNKHSWRCLKQSHVHSHRAPACTNGIPVTATVWYWEEINQIYTLLRASQTIMFDTLKINLPRKYSFNIRFYRIRNVLSHSSLPSLVLGGLPWFSQSPEVYCRCHPDLHHRSRLPSVIDCSFDWKISRSHLSNSTNIPVCAHS